MTPTRQSGLEYQERRSKLTNDEIKSQQAADLLEKKGDFQAAYRPGSRATDAWRRHTSSWACGAIAMG